MMSSNINFICGWSGLLLGFLSGTALGMFFHQENWLGGYGSLKRRLYRLGHISFFGLGVVNLMFAFTARNFSLPPQVMQLSAAMFIVGAVSMPMCCILMAHYPKTRLLFAVPILSLLTGGIGVLSATFKLLR
ncbi:MAG TPA: hypothetical protein VLT36_22145 [Candidatus Dormibacteraeota bacterium]|nr:hypothetical protein [Candidatus Dormibacteraeota bacterium]